MFYTSILIAGNLACFPFERLWDKTIPGTCINRPAIDVASGAINVFSHFLTFLLPQKIIWNLHLPTTKKIGIGFVFAVGMMYVMFSSVRVLYLLFIKKVH